MKNRTARPPRSRFASYPASASRALPVVTGCPASPADRHPRPGCPPATSQSLVSGGHKQQRLRRQRDPWVRRTLGNPRGDAKQRQLIATSDRSAIDILVIGRQSPLRNRRSGLPGARGQPILMAALEHPDMREPCPDQHRDDIGAERRVRARPLADKQLTDEVLGERGAAYCAAAYPRRTSAIAVSGARLVRFVVRGIIRPDLAPRPTAR